MEKNLLYNSHNVNLIDRKEISFTGINKINSFDDNEFLVESVMGKILIKGESLELFKIDINNGELSIKGKINAINYFEDSNKKIKAENIISRLFK